MKKKNGIFEEQELDVPEFSEECEKLSEREIKTVEEQKGLVPDKSNDKPTRKRFSKKALFTVLFVLFNVVAILVTALLDFTGQDDVQPIETVLGTFAENYKYGLIALLMFVVAIVCHGMMRFFLLLASTGKGRLRLSLKTAIIGKYYDYVTPLGSGGQPFEIYYLNKKGIPGSIASGIAITCYILSQLASVTVCIGVIAWKGFQHVDTIIEILAITGIAFNTILPLGVLFFSILPNFGKGLARFVTKVLKALRFVKDPEKFEEKAVRTLTEYADCIRFFFSKYGIATLCSFLFAFVYQFAVYSMPYFVMKFCGVSDLDYFQLLDLCIICYCAMTIFPTPGNSGAAEISFHSIFSTYLVSGGILFWGIMTWRLVSFYSFIIAGLILMLCEKIISVKRKKKSLACPAEGKAEAANEPTAANEEPAETTDTDEKQN